MPMVRLGVIPTYGDSDGEGFEIAGVTEGGPAAKGGMKDDDRIYKIGKYKIGDVYAYMEALRKYKPGEKVTVIVIRDGEKKVLTIKAGAPKPPEEDG